MQYFIVSLLLLIILFSARIIYWYLNFSTQKKFGFGIKYLGKVISPWNGIEKALKGVQATLNEVYGPEYANKLLERVHIRIVSEEYKLKNSKSKLHCGTDNLFHNFEVHKFLPFCPDHYVINIVQNNDCKDDIGKSMFFHSISQHLVSLKRFSDLNSNHIKSDLDELHRLFKREYWKK